MTQIAQSIPKRRPGPGFRSLLFVGAGMVVSLLVSAPFLLKLPARASHFRETAPVIAPPSTEPPPVDPDGPEPVPELGFVLKPIPPEIAARLGNSRGGLISGVSPDGPAFRGGVRDGDLLIGVGSLSISDRALLRRCLDGVPRGGNVSLTILRDHRERHVLVVIPGTLPSAR
jgi:S1-C subfamily serine protease